MRLITTLTQLLLTLLSLALFAWAGYQGYQLLSSKQQILDQETQAILVIGAIVILVGGYLLASAIRKGAATIALNPIKATLYEQFILNWQTLEETNKMTNEKMTTLKRSLALMGSHQVIQKVNQLLDLVKAEAFTSLKLEKALEEVLLAMRNDLGQAPHYNSKKEIQQLLSNTKQEKTT